jgi:hypothetical protein
MSYAGIYASTYLDTYGTPFPDAPLDLTCELDLPADGWTNVTSYVYQRDSNTPVTITRGRPDESSQVNPSSAAFQLNNRDGRFTVKNPVGAYYGQLNRNTPVRFSVPATETYLRFEDDNLSYASAPDASRLDITGDTDVRIDVRLSDYQACLLASKYHSGTNKSWALALNGNGTVTFQFQDNTSTVHAITSTMPVPLGRIAIRATIQVNNGSGGHVTTFYTAPSISGTWTQLGSAVTGSLALTLATSTAPVVIGYVSDYAADSPGADGCLGAVYGFQVLSGIGGTVEADADFTAQAAGTTSFTDAQGNTWTLNGTAEISGRDYRYHGEMSSLPVAWDPSGNDVWTPAAAGGLLRRLGQGNAPTYSAMKRAILSLSGGLAPVAYWPCEDLGGADAFGSAIGGPLMAINGTPDFAADSAFACSAPLPTISSSIWHGPVPSYTPTGVWTVRFLLDVTSTPAEDVKYVQVATLGDFTSIYLYASGEDGGYGLAGRGAGDLGFDTGVYAFGLDTAWVSIEAQNGGFSLTMLAPGASTGENISTGNIGATITNVTGVYVNPAGASISAGLGHITVQTAWESLFDLYEPLNAWQGELAGNRFARLCSENGLGCRIWGFPQVTQAMGQQSVSTLTDLLQECESADLGMIFEPRQALALGYITQAALCNQAAAATLDYSAKVLGGTGQDMTPTYDDQYTRNDMTVQQGGQSGSSTTQTGGSYRAYLDDGSAMSISPPPVGVGDYSDSATANVASTSQLPDIAGQLVHLGTVDDFRWPDVPVNMARAAVAGIQAAVQACDIGNYVIIENPPGQLPPDPITQLIAQSVEVLGGFRWTIVFSCIPESPYETGLYDDPVYGRGDTDGSELAAGVSSSATMLSVSTTGPSGLIWTTVAADFPFDINVGGERMTVTDITGSSSPQSFTVTRSVNGVVKSHSAGADVRLWTPPVYALQ